MTLARILRCSLFPLLTFVSLACAACSTGKEFRSVAGPAVHQGISAILNGLLDGIFAAVMPDSPSNGS